MKSMHFLKYLVLNTFLFIVLIYLFFLGFATKVVDADQTYLSVIIFGLFLFGIITTCHYIIIISNKISKIKDLHPTDIDQFYLIDLTENYLNEKLHNVRYLGNSLVHLGLIGTVLGFIIALSGVSPETVSNIESIKPLVSSLIAGISTALYTTLVGAIFNLWTMANYCILNTAATECLNQSIIEGDALPRGRG